MGQYSQVVIVMDKENYDNFMYNVELLKEHPYTKDKIYQEVLDILNRDRTTFIEKEDNYLFFWESIKWYTSFPENPCYWVDRCLSIVDYSLPITRENIKEYSLVDCRTLNTNKLKYLEIGVADEPYCNDIGNYYDNPFNVGYNYSIVFNE